jgi:hypothetical protein
VAASPLLSLSQSLLKSLQLDELGGGLGQHGRGLAGALPLLSGIVGIHQNLLLAMGQPAKTALFAGDQARCPMKLP